MFQLVSKNCFIILHAQYVLQICTETVENIRVVTSLTQEGTFKKKYNKLVDDLCR